MKRFSAKTSTLFGLLYGITLFLSALLHAEENSNIIKDEEGRHFYVVQKGDTLWGISKRFLDSPWYWPEVWKENSGLPIPNPHLIFPGQRIRLFRKGEAPPPVAGLPESPEPVSPETLPPSLPSAEPLPPISPPLPSNYVFSAIDQVGFIRKEPVRPSGKILRERNGKKMISEGDTVYLSHGADEELVAGKRYTVYRTSGPLFDTPSNALIGTQHILLGLVEIIRKEDVLAIGRIVKSFRDIKVTDLVMPEEQHSPIIEISASPQDIAGKIFFSENHSFIFGEHDIAFIDKGELDGVKTGQQYAVFEQNTIQPKAGSKAVIPLPADDIGSLLVLRTESDTATVLITVSEKNFSAGIGIRSLTP